MALPTRLILPAAICLLALAACQNQPASQDNANGPAGGSDLHTIRLAEISVTPGGDVAQVRGRFTYARANAGEKSIASDGHGGACLVQLQSPATACTGAQTQGKGASECSPPLNGWGYCLDRHGIVSGGGGGQCWIKGPGDCLRAPRENNGQLLVAGQSYDVPRTGTVAVNRPASVRMLACVNPPASQWPLGPDGTTRVPPCSLPSSSQRIDIVGPVRPIP